MPRLSGRQVKHRPSLARQPVQPRERAQPPQQELGGNRLDPVAAQVLVPFDRVVHVPRQPLAGTCQRGKHATDPVTADAEVSLDVSLERLVGHLWGMTAQDHQDLNGGRVSRATNRSARVAVIPPGAGPRA